MREADKGRENTKRKRMAQRPRQKGARDSQKGSQRQPLSGEDTVKKRPKARCREGQNLSWEGILL